MLLGTRLRDIYLHDCDVEKHIPYLHRKLNAKSNIVNSFRSQKIEATVILESSDKILELDN